MFEWDLAKSVANLEKHGVSFEEASLIFDAPVLSKRDERQDYGEARTISIGRIRNVVVVAVVHPDRSGSTRIISARLAGRRERRLYDEHIG